MASMAAMEQATLGQYFTTRRKGVEGLHPAKRRKLDVTEIESDVAVRRSQRTKKQVASSQTKISIKGGSRSGKGGKSNAKGSLNEDSVQSSYKGSKVVSETTSLFDDHAFAEALIGKLTVAQRKRKMASSTQMEEAVPRDKSDVEISQAQANKDEMESKPKGRRRTAKSSKSVKQPEKSENSKILEATEQVISLSDQTPREAVIPVGKETAASPSKTPPVVRRINGGVKANPWIAEQAKTVLSRGRAAVNFSQKSRNKEEKQITASKDSSSVGNSKDATVNANVNKAQEDLAKARKLIKTMRSLEKKASKPSQSSTGDDGTRLHQVASSKSSAGKEESQSLKVPAYERFHALAQPVLSDISSATLPLPYKYKTLAEMFRCTETVLNLLGQRKEKCTFPKLRDAVQQMSRKRFEKKHLAQMKTVYPSALEFRQDKCPGKSSSFELTVEFGKTEESLSKLTLTASEMLARKDTFLTNLLKLTKKHHQDFLCNLNPALSVDDKKIMRWHPKFRLDDVPDVDEADLPQPPAVKTYSSAHDVLEKARDMIAPRVEKALKTVALKEQEDREQRTINKKNSNLVEKKVLTKLEENNENKNSLKHKSALKGISQDLLNKIRQKEAKKIEENIMRDPLVDKKLAMKERFPDLCRILKAYFSAERKAAIPLDDATVKLSESYKTSLSSVQVEEHIRFMAQLVPEWISVLTVRKCAYIKINKTADVNNVINKLTTKEFH